HCNAPLLIEIFVQSIQVFSRHVYGIQLSISIDVSNIDTSCTISPSILVKRTAGNCAWNPVSTVINVYRGVKLIDVSLYYIVFDIPEKQGSVLVFVNRKIGL